MEKIKNLILDFIFSSFESFVSLLSSIASLNISQFKQTCYQIPALDYFGIIFLGFASFKLLMFSKKWMGLRLQTLLKCFQKIFQKYRSKKKFKYSKLKFQINNNHIQSNPQIQKECVLCDCKTSIIHSIPQLLVPKPVLNNEETQVFNFLKQNTQNTCFDVLSQVPLRAFFKTQKDTLSHFVVGGMYVDFLLINKYTNLPICVIEYFGEGHYGNNENKKAYVQGNDKIKQAIFNEAKIQFFVITKDAFFDQSNTIHSDIKHFIHNYRHT